MSALEGNAEVDGAGPSAAIVPGVVDADDLGGSVVRFFEAAKEGNVAEVIRLLDEGGLDVNSENNDGMTALMLAAEGGHTAVASALLERKASFFAKERDVMSFCQPAITPFQLAVLNFDKSEGVCRLIAQQAGFKIDYWHQPVYLPDVVATGNERAVRYLVEELGVSANGSGCTWRSPTALHVAAETKNAPLCRYLLAKGADPFATAHGKRSPLFYAKSKEVLLLLLEAGLHVQVQERDEYGMRPILAMASEGADLDALQALEAAGADVKAVDAEGRTCLHYCCEKGSEAVAAWLLDKGLDIDAADRWQRTPLHHCAKAGNAKLCRFLLSRGANPHALGPFNKTPIFFVKEQEVLAALLQAGADLEARDERGNTPLLAVVNFLGKPDMLEHFRAAGANMFARDNDDCNVYFKACELGFVATVEWCLSNGFSLDSVDPSGQTALHYAVRGNNYHPDRAKLCDHIKLIRLLVERGIPIDVTDNDGNTPLAKVSAHACMHQFPGGLPLLLFELGADISLLADKGCRLMLESCECGNEVVAQHMLENLHYDVNAQDDQGRTALHASAAGGNLGISKLLLAKGAKLQTRDRYGETPFAAAADDGRDEVALYFLEQGMDLTVTEGQDGPLHAAAVGGRDVLVRALLDRGLSVHAKGRDGRTPLHALVTSEYNFSEAASQTLLDAGADIEARDGFSRTPLLAATWPYTSSDNVRAVDFFLAKGANVEAKSGFGETVLGQAVRKSNYELCRTLIKHGADINAPGPLGAPIHAAFFRNDRTQGGLSFQVMLLLLIGHGAKLDSEANPIFFPFPSLDAGLASELAPVLTTQLCSRTEALVLHRKVLDWALASPAVAAALPGWMAELRRGEGPDFQRSLDWDSSMQLRTQKVSAIGDVAWDRRKELVAAFALARKDRFGGGAAKRAKISSPSEEEEQEDQGSEEK